MVHIIYGTHNIWYIERVIQWTHHITNTQHKQTIKDKNTGHYDIIISIWCLTNSNKIVPNKINLQKYTFASWLN